MCVSRVVLLALYYYHNDITIVYSGRFPYPGPSSDNAVWMMGNPNWGTINLHLGEVSHYLLQSLKHIVPGILCIHSLQGQFNYDSNYNKSLRDVRLIITLEWIPECIL